MEITWTSADLDGTMEEYRTQLGAINDQFIQEAENAADNAARAEIRSRQRAAQEVLDRSYRVRVSDFRDHSRRKLFPEMATIDLETLVYDGDINYQLEFALDPGIQAAWRGMRDNNPVFRARRELLKSALRLTPKLAPQLFAVLDRCVAALGLRVPVELYVRQDASFNAACFPPDDKRLYIIVHSGLLEKFREDELAFILGHEIGHAVFSHHRYPAEAIMEVGADYLSPLHRMKLYAWSRASEITADRCGLLTCADLNSAMRAFFKLSSGITGGKLQFDLREYLAQFAELEAEMNDGDISPEDWFSTHPFSPIRIKALQLFAGSDTYLKLAGREGAAATDEKNLETEVARFMAMMEPYFLQEPDDSGRLVQEFLFFAAWRIGMADGEWEESEIRALNTLVSPDVCAACNQKLGEADFDATEEGQDIGLRLLTLISPAERLGIIRDLCLICTADGMTDEAETRVLYQICGEIKVATEFADRMLAETARAAD